MRSWIRGDTQILEIEVVDADGDAIDLTGGRLSFTMNAAANPLLDTGAVVQKDVTSFTAPTTGIQEITIETADTNTVVIGKYWYDVQFRSSTGNVMSRVRNRINLVPDTTRRNTAS